MRASTAVDGADALACTDRTASVKAKAPARRPASCAPGQWSGNVKPKRRKARRPAKATREPLSHAETLRAANRSKPPPSFCRSSPLTAGLRRHPRPIHSPATTEVRPGESRRFDRDSRVARPPLPPFAGWRLPRSILATIVGAFLYWRHTELYPTTENAYTGSNIVRVAPEVSRSRHSRLRRDRRAGEDRRSSFRHRSHALRGGVPQCPRAIRRCRRQRRHRRRRLTRRPPTLEEKRKALEDALADLPRRQGRKQAPASRRRRRSPTRRRAGRRRSRPTRTRPPRSPPSKTSPLTVTTPTVQLRAASADLDKATRDRARTHVTAPSDGVVSNVTLRPGATVAAGTPALRHHRRQSAGGSTPTSRRPISPASRSGSRPRSGSTCIPACSLRGRGRKHQLGLRRRLLGAAGRRTPPAIG